MKKFLILYKIDNLYLDMNGVIHNCSHPKVDDAKFRISEEQIYIGIFHYVEMLFSKIKPKNTFFIAVDGVAPRAKMNQQRSRRFRAAQTAQELKQEALAKGEVLPDEDPFDSNCITPGTEFMAKLSVQMDYFIKKKMNEDANWRKVNVIFSGHEVPGEGEHKIMDYIRYLKTLPNYNPNLRHCIYGLDSDLIVLSLISHEPHFALLREEIIFGRQKKTDSKNFLNFESQLFYLLHTANLREYINAEFTMLKQVKGFDFDLEKIIDDFALMTFFVGNDFLPNLPSLEINQNAFGILFDLYKQLVPTIGYLHNRGKLNIKTFETFISHLKKYELDVFNSQLVDTDFMKAKSVKNDQDKMKLKIEMTPYQGKIFEKIKNGFLNGKPEQLSLSTLSKKNKEFTTVLCERMGIPYRNDVNQNGNSCLVIDFIKKPKEDGEPDDSVPKVELRDCMNVIADYDAIKKELDEKVEIKDPYADPKFIQWKKDYYMTKMKLDYDDDKQLKEIVYHYIEGIQWVLYYYYEGIPSWGWFFPYHYAPKISDIENISEFDIKFELGEPFHPFEQLMSVLPSASRQLIPSVYRDLMTDDSSPLKEFYPEEFSVDLNGKKNSWEAIVLIPFIDQDKLIAELKKRENLLTDEEKKRNQFRDATLYKYNEKFVTKCDSPLPLYFPNIAECHTQAKEFKQKRLTSKEVVKEISQDSLLGKTLLGGFPCFQSIPFTPSLELHGVKVFNSESQKESIVLNVVDLFKNKSAENIALEMLSRPVYVDWPFLYEGYVVSIMDEKFEYYFNNNDSKTHKNLNRRPLSERDKASFIQSSLTIEHNYSKKMGVVIGSVKYIAKVALLKGMKRLSDGSLVKEYENTVNQYALQTIIKDVKNKDTRYIEKPPIEGLKEFPLGTSVFLLENNQYYGSPGTVVGYNGDYLTIDILPDQYGQINKSIKEIVQVNSKNLQYLPSWQVAKELNISPLTLSRVTSSFLIDCKSHDKKVNIGLSLKFDGKEKKVINYTKKEEKGWQYSTLAVEHIKKYKKAFGEVFEYLEKLTSQKFKDVCDTDIFPEDEAKEKVEKIQQWLNENETGNVVNIETEILEQDVVSKIEDFVESKLKEGIEPPKTLRLKNIQRNKVLKPCHAEYRLGDQQFSVGDRIIGVQDYENIPLGLKGTVIAVKKNNVDILFDQQHMSCSDLGGRCKTYRGMTVHKYSILNLSCIQPPPELMKVEKPSLNTIISNKKYYDKNEKGNNSPKSQQTKQYLRRFYSSDYKIDKKDPTTQEEKVARQKSFNQPPPAVNAWNKKNITILSNSNNKGRNSPPNEKKNLAKKDNNTNTTSNNNNNKNNNNLDSMSINIKKMLNINPDDTRFNKRKEDVKKGISVEELEKKIIGKNETTETANNTKSDAASNATSKTTPTKDNKPEPVKQESLQDMSNNILNILRDDNPNKENAPPPPPPPMDIPMMPGMYPPFYIPTPPQMYPPPPSIIQGGMSPPPMIPQFFGIPFNMMDQNGMNMRPPPPFVNPAMMNNPVLPNNTNPASTNDNTNTNAVDDNKNNSTSTNSNDNTNSNANANVNDNANANNNKNHNNRNNNSTNKNNRNNGNRNNNRNNYYKNKNNNRYNNNNGNSNNNNNNNGNGNNRNNNNRGYNKNTNNNYNRNNNRNRYNNQNNNNKKVNTTSTPNNS